MNDHAPLVVVTGPPDAADVAQALAVQLGRTLVSLARIEADLADRAEDTPEGWLRHDAELEVVRRLTAFSGVAVLDLTVEPPPSPARVAALLRAWAPGFVEIKCLVPGADRESVGASRTIVLDASRQVTPGDIASVVRRETGARRVVRRG